MGFDCDGGGGIRTAYVICKLMNICDSFIFVVLRWAVLLAKLPAFVVTGGMKGSHITSVPGGGHGLDLQVKIVYSSCPSSAQLPPIHP